MRRFCSVLYLLHSNVGITTPPPHGITEAPVISSYSSVSKLSGFRMYSSDCLTNAGVMSEYLIDSNIFENKKGLGHSRRPNLNR